MFAAVDQVSARVKPCKVSCRGRFNFICLAHYFCPKILKSLCEISQSRIKLCLHRRRAASRVRARLRRRNAVRIGLVARVSRQLGVHARRRTCRVKVRRLLPAVSEVSARIKTGEVPGHRVLSLIRLRCQLRPRGIVSARDLRRPVRLGLCPVRLGFGASRRARSRRFTGLRVRLTRFRRRCTRGSGLHRFRHPGSARSSSRFTGLGRSRACRGARLGRLGVRLALLGIGFACPGGRGRPGGGRLALLRRRSARRCRIFGFSSIGFTGLRRCLRCLGIGFARLCGGLTGFCRRRALGSSGSRTRCRLRAGRRVSFAGSRRRLACFGIRFRTFRRARGSLSRVPRRLRATLRGLRRRFGLSRRLCRALRAGLRGFRRRPRRLRLCAVVLRVVGILPRPGSGPAHSVAL